MELELFLFGEETQKYCGEIFRSMFPQIPVKNSEKNCGEFILLRRLKPVEYWCIFDSRQEQVLQMAEHYHLRAMTCGFSSYNTLVLSACDEQTASVSLQREIYSVFGAVVEPGDFLIHRGSCAPEEALLLCAATLLLIGEGKEEFHF